MNPIELEYRRLRRGYTLPARWAWDWCRRKERLKARKAELGFAWQTEPGASRRAVWYQEGFELIASIVADPDGGSLHGIDALGRFSDRWEAGAISHHWGNGRGFRWFIPAEAKTRHAAYRRACDFGEGWCHVAVEVQARRHGVVLAETSLGGIESDTEEDYFTEMVLELADEAIAQARSTLRRLCGGQCRENEAI